MRRIRELLALLGEATQGQTRGRQKRTWGSLIHDAGEDARREVGTDERHTEKECRKRQTK